LRVEQRAQIICADSFLPRPRVSSWNHSPLRCSAPEPATDTWKNIRVCFIT